MNDLGAFAFQKRCEHADGVTVCPRYFVFRERRRLGAHDRGTNFRTDLDNSVDAAGKVVGFRLQFAAGLGQVFVADAVLVQQLLQYKSIELRPTRTRDASHIAYKLDVVLLQEFEEVGKCMPAVADAIDDYHERTLSLQQYLRIPLSDRQ